MREMSIIDTHEAALPIWRAAGARGRVLVHVDAHHDMWACGPSIGVTPANVVRAAIAEGVAASVFWIVPDPAWTSPRCRVALFRHLRRIKDPATSIVERPGEIALVVEKRPVRVRPLRAAPDPAAGMLLDVDADVMTIASIEYKRRERASRPWIAVRDLARRLHDLAGRSEIVTIVRSCDGGFTPLEYRWIADALAAGLADRRVAAFDAMTDGMDALERGDGDRAQRILHTALEGPASAAASFALAIVDASRGRASDAQAWCARAVRADAAYRSPYRSRGFVEYFAGEHDAARREFIDSLRVDPDDQYAYLGLGMLARARRRPRDADTALTRAIALDPGLVDAHRERAEAFVSLGRWFEARQGFLDALRLMNGGARAIGPDGWRPSARDVGWLHARLSRVAAQLGETRAAVRHGVEARAAGFDTAALRRRLAALALRTHAWRDAWTHGAAALRASAHERMHDFRVATEDLALAIRR